MYFEHPARNCGDVFKTLQKMYCGAFCENISWFITVNYFCKNLHNWFLDQVLIMPLCRSNHLLNFQLKEDTSNHEAKSTLQFIFRSSHRRYSLKFCIIHKKNTWVRVPFETLKEVFSSENRKIFKNIYFEEHLRMAASTYSETYQ